jgi:hypothetical protein
MFFDQFSIKIFGFLKCKFQLTEEFGNGYFWISDKEFGDVIAGEASAKWQKTLDRCSQGSYAT